MSLDLIFGIVIGMVLTLIALAVGLFFLVRDNTPPALVPAEVPDLSPAVTVLMIEPFLNQQLRDALSIETLELDQEFANAPVGGLPLDLKLGDAVLSVKPGRRAEFAAQLTASVWGLSVKVRPVTTFTFVPQGGRVKIVINQVQVRGFQVPRVLIDRFVQEVVSSAEAKLNHSLAELQADTGVHLADIETTEDLLILKFV